MQSESPDDDPRKADEGQTPISPLESVADVGQGIRLDDLLKRLGIAQTGGHAKLLIQSGEVLLNGEVELRRRKQLAPGDVIEVFGQTVVVDERSLHR